MVLMVLGKLRDYWETLNPETKMSIDYIGFGDNAYFERRIGDKKFGEKINLF